MIDCAGCPQGLGILEQVSWARNTKHPNMGFPVVKADFHWWRAIAFETSTERKDIGSWRSLVMKRYRGLALKFGPERKKWFKKVPKPLRKMMARVHGPLIRMITEDMAF